MPLFLEDVLHGLGYNQVFVADNAYDALELAKKEHINLAFLDINIEKDIDGIQCAMLLNQLYTIPIIYITAYSNSSIVEEASQTNLYGYLTKPFTQDDIFISLKVLQKQLLRKEEESVESTKIYLLNKCYFDSQNQTLFYENEEIKLTKKERLLLAVLVQNLEYTVSYENLKQSVWEDKNISLSAIRDAVLRLRKKLPCIELESTIGVGYKLHAKLT